MGSRNRPQVRALAICFQVLRPEFWAVLQLFMPEMPATPYRLGGFGAAISLLPVKSPGR